MNRGFRGRDSDTMKKTQFFATPLILATLLAPGSGRARPTQDPPQRSPQPLKVEAETIALNVLALDRQGSPMAGLTKDDFRIYEDKVEQQIVNFFAVDAPFSIALVLDTSSSAVDKLAIIQNSAIEFIRSLHPDDEVMVVSFDDEVHLETDFTRDHDRAERAVKQTRTGDRTQLYEAVYLSMEELRQRPDRKIMVLFTDGIDTASPTTSLKETIEFSKESDITVYTIFFDTERDMLRAYRGGGTIGPPGTPGTIPGRNPGPAGIPGTSPLPYPTPSPGGVGGYPPNMRQEYLQARAYLRELAKVTGGSSFSAQGDLSDLAFAFAQIANELRSLYTIGYISSNPKDDGKFRSIKVEIDRKGARVRAREGYYPFHRKKG